MSRLHIIKSHLILTKDPGRRENRKKNPLSANGDSRDLEVNLPCIPYRFSKCAILII